MNQITPRSHSATASLAAVLADPRLAAEVAAQLETVTITTKGGKKATGALAKPARKGPAILLIHEWWGLNDQIKAVAAEFASQGYLALACDVYDGKVTNDPGKAGAFMEALDPAKATDILTSWADWLRKSPDGNGKLATIGWCMGGGSLLSLSILLLSLSPSLPSAWEETLDGPTPPSRRLLPEIPPELAQTSESY